MLTPFFVGFDDVNQGDSDPEEDGLFPALTSELDLPSLFGLVAIFLADWISINRNHPIKSPVNDKQKCLQTSKFQFLIFELR